MICDDLTSGSIFLPFTVKETVHHGDTGGSDGARREWQILSHLSAIGGLGDISFVVQNPSPTDSLRLSKLKLAHL